MNKVIPSIDDIIVEVLLSVGWDTIQNGIMATVKLIQLAQYERLTFTIHCIDFIPIFSQTLAPVDCKSHLPFPTKVWWNTLASLQLGRGFSTRELYSSFMEQRALTDLGDTLTSREMSIEGFLNFKETIDIVEDYAHDTKCTWRIRSHDLWHNFVPFSHWTHRLEERASFCDSAARFLLANQKHKIL